MPNNKKAPERSGLASLFGTKSKPGFTHNKSSAKRSAPAQPDAASADARQAYPESIISARSNLQSPQSRKGFRVAGHCTFSGDLSPNCSSSALARDATSVQLAALSSTTDANVSHTSAPPSHGGTAQLFMGQGGFATVIGFRGNSNYAVPRAMSETNIPAMARSSSADVLGNDNAVNSQSSTPPYNAGASVNTVTMSSFQQIHDSPGGEAQETNANRTHANTSATGVDHSCRSPQEAALFSLVSGVSTGTSSGQGTATSIAPMPDGGFANILGGGAPPPVPASSSNNWLIGTSHGRTAVFSSWETTSAKKKPLDPRGTRSGVSATSQPHSLNDDKAPRDAATEFPKAYSMPAVLHTTPQYIGFGSSLPYSQDGASSPQATDLYLRSTNFLRGMSASRSGTASGAAENATTSSSTLDNVNNVTGVSPSPTTTRCCAALMTASIGANASISTTNQIRPPLMYVPHQPGVASGPPAAVMSPTLPNVDTTSFAASQMGQYIEVPPPTARTSSPPSSAVAAASIVSMDEEAQARMHLTALATQLTDSLRTTCAIADQIRAAGGNSNTYGFKDRQSVMMLYGLMGLDEDPNDGRTSRFQQRLQRYRFPPPDMEKLASMDGPDEETMNFMLGGTESRRRARIAAKNAKNLLRSREQPLPLFDADAVVAEYARRRPHPPRQSGQNDSLGALAGVIDRPEEVAAHQRVRLFVAQPYGLDSEESDSEGEAELVSPLKSDG